MSTSKKEVSLSAYKAVELKLAKSKDTTKQLRMEGRQLRKRLKAVEASRAAWRTKAVQRQHSCRALEKRFKRQKSSVQPRRHHYLTWLVTLVVVLRIYCHCSYGSIRKVIGVLQTDYMYGVHQRWKKQLVPSEPTLQNWVSKVGFFHLQQPDNGLVNQELCLIIDESVRVGTEKLLVALACPIHKQQEGYLSIQEVSVVGLWGARSWKGQQIATFLSDCIAKHQLQVQYILSDEGNNLVKAAHLLGLPHLLDISHLVATCLRRTFENTEAYKDFCTAVVRCQSKLAMGAYCYLRPPKQRAKGRFLNQQKIVDWAITILDKWDQLEEQAQEKLNPIRTHSNIIESLKACIDYATQTATLLKKKGLSENRIQEALNTLTQKLDDNQLCPWQTTFLNHLKTYFLNYQYFIQQQDFKAHSVHTCSDVIERLFGMYKAKLSDNFFVNTTTIGLELPLLCMDRQAVLPSIQTALEAVTMTKLKEWRQKQNPDNQSSKRAGFFKK